MAQYINKDALVAEIERRKDIEVDYDESSNSFASYGDETHYFALDSIEDFINTLEVKKVDLEEEINLYIESSLTGVDPIYTKNAVSYIINRAAKHFFELGLKAQKGE